MAASDKNKPATIFIIGVAAIAIALISYFVLLFLFPGVLENLLTGEQPPVIEK